MNIPNLQLKNNTFLDELSQNTIQGIKNQYTNTHRTPHTHIWVDINKFYWGLPLTKKKQNNHNQGWVFFFFLILGVWASLHALRLIPQDPCTVPSEVSLHRSG